MNCEKCGTPLNGTAFCENCGHTNEQPVAPTQQSSAPIEKRENVITGIVGALIGAAIGAASIILLGQLGYVASISGLILAVCTLKGYELLGGKLTTKGIIISILLMLATPYLADRISIAITLCGELESFGVTFGSAFQMIPELIEMDSELKSEYYGNLAMLYGFAALGAGSTIYSAFKKKK